MRGCKRLNLPCRPTQEAELCGRIRSFGTSMSRIIRIIPNNATMQLSRAKEQIILGSGQSPEMAFTQNPVYARVLFVPPRPTTSSKGPVPSDHKSLTTNLPKCQFRPRKPLECSEKPVEGRTSRGIGRIHKARFPLAVESEIVDGVVALGVGDGVEMLPGLRIE
jgi:hypothetical protein